MAPTASSRPTVAELQNGNSFAETARRNWLGSTASRKVKPDVLKTEVWDVLQEESFPFRSLLILDNLQLLERYLWPGYNEHASHFHVLLITLMVNVKSRESLPIWNIFNDRPQDFSSLFRRVLSMSLDSSLPTILKIYLLSFLISAFQSLDNGLVRKECAPLLSISMWHNLSSEEARIAKFEEHPQLKKPWRAAGKKFDVADAGSKDRQRFDRLWLCSMIQDFMRRLYEPVGIASDNLLYCERFIELLTDIESQLPTRRYANTLLQDLNVLPAIRLSSLFSEEQNGLLRDLFSLLRHYMYFSVDDYTGIPFSQLESYDNHCKILARLQRTAFKHFESKLTILALSNFASISERSDLEGHLAVLTHEELDRLCSILGYRTAYPKGSGLIVNREFLLEIILSTHERRNTYQDVARELSICPTESTLFEPALLRNETYDGSRPLAIPKLNLQYLTVGDFLWRSFILHRCEAFFEIRKNMEDAIKRLQPRAQRPDKGINFEGFSRMAIPIPKPAILDVAMPKVGEDHPAFVRAEITLDVSSLNDGIRSEWDALRPDDTVFLLSVQPPDDSARRPDAVSRDSTAREVGLRHLRVADVVQVLDEKGRSLRDAGSNQNDDGYVPRPRLRRLLVNLDPKAYKSDRENATKGKPDIYESINVLVRRRGRENNFKAVLTTIQTLTMSEVPIPAWLEEVFLGYGDPTSANYANLANRIKSIDFRDTFLDWHHLVQSLPGKTVEPDEKASSSFGPPYILESVTVDAQKDDARQSKKRRRGEPEPGSRPEAPSHESVKASTYKPLNNGPYPTDAPRTNRVRFTPTQAEAIISGTQPGLTVIVGPPGTGKTDVATQIINNLYHNFPEQRTLLIARSNQALNQLFQKIMVLDIDERHLLRLGHGEEDLVADSDYSKHGRVESFLENRTRYLVEVDRLAANFGAPGAHGSSCETADYFNAVYVKPAWSRFESFMEGAEAASDVIDAFPFHAYFSNAPQPLFPPDAPLDVVKEIATGCFRHIVRIFTELEDIRPFEILRSPREKANYLLVKEARIVAMTSTHAAMRRQEIVGLGFHYENVVMEEAAQITEIENFIPLAMQRPKAGELPLQRVVLCGDHLQNSPIVQNVAFGQYANLEQSLFLRLVRLGVPTVNLDQQGRARPSLAELYRWRYERLGDLPTVQSEAEFQVANAGFRHEYQFIDVPDYKDVGESEPTPHFFQNLGEAEYAVAIFQYMRLLGYPASKISILATYAGQRSLIRDVLNHRCAKNRLFGLPKTVTTVDQYQGEQNDYIILSLTRSSRVGYLRDIRRLTVALSRARLGLYVLGRRDVFESCYELKPAIDRLLKHPDRLLLTHGEMYPATRTLEQDAESFEMEGVEHIGKYVYQMTQAKIAAVKGAATNGDAEPTPAAPPAEEGDEGAMPEG